MATKQQVMAAGRKKLGKQRFWFTDHKKPSSPRLRAEATANRKELQDELNRTKAIVDATPQRATIEPLIDAARFVIDVQGDPTALAVLEQKLLAAEAARDALEDWRNAKAAFGDRKGGENYHRYEISTEVIRNFAHSVDSSADTLDELLAAIKGQKAAVV